MLGLVLGTRVSYTVLSRVILWLPNSCQDLVHLMLCVIEARCSIKSVGGPRYLFVQKNKVQRPLLKASLKEYTILT